MQSNAKYLTSHFTEDTWMANKRMKRSPMSLIISEMQIIATIYHFTSIKMSVIKKDNNNFLQSF